MPLYFILHESAATYYQPRNTINRGFYMFNKKTSEMVKAVDLLDLTISHIF